MKVSAIILCLYLCGSIVQAQNSIFSHAYGDGFSLTSITETSALICNNIYTHGPGDGFSSLTIKELSSAISNAIFTHGTGDGYGSKTLWQVIAPGNNTIFAHGSSDGFDFKMINETSSLGVNNLIFAHGYGDGFALLIYSDAAGARTAVARIATEPEAQESFTDKFAVFPNPTTGDLIIQFEEGLKQKKVQIINLVGNVVYEQSYSSFQGTLDLKRLPKGVYLMYVFDADNTFSQRIVLY